MPSSKTVLVTGASRGLGKEAATAAAALGANVICAGRTKRTIETVAKQARGHVSLFDLASLRSVRNAAAELPHVDALACSAGIQFVHSPTLTGDGFEHTFQVNHLAHLVLIDTLLARPDPPKRIVLLGSSTHDPAIRTGTPDPLEGDATAMARSADLGQDDARTSGIRRYTTSKLLTVATAAALARERPDLHVSAFDPGLMPGTGLARDFPLGFRLLWNSVLKGLRILPFASSARRSGAALATLLTAEPPPAESGAYVDYRLNSLAPSTRAADPCFQDAVLRDSRALVATTAI